MRNVLKIETFSTYLSDDLDKTVNGDRRLNVTLRRVGFLNVVSLNVTLLMLNEACALSGHICVKIRGCLLYLIDSNVGRCCIMMLLDQQQRWMRQIPENFTKLQHQTVIWGFM